MALAQPTDLLVQNLNTLITVDQSVERHNLTDVLITESGDILATEDGQDLASERLTIIQLMQLVDDSARLNEGGTLVTFDQTVIFERDNPAQTLITLAQDVERHNGVRTLVRLRQIVQAEAADNPTYIFLDDNDISARCSPAIEITASEGSNRTATVVYRPPSGSLNIPSFQGRSLTIQREIDGRLVTLFVGTVDVPTYDRYERTLQLRCSDLRDERLGRESQSNLKSMTGGLYSDVTQRRDATGEQWVRELMKTVTGSLDYTSAGTLRFRDWAIGTPRYNLAADDIFHREIQLEFATRSEIINRVPATLEYRYSQRRAIAHNVQVSMRREAGTSLPKAGDIVPTREAIRSAMTSVGSWSAISYTFEDVPESGWYRDKSSALIKRIGWSASDAFRSSRAMGGSATLKRFISQPNREVYDLSVEAPQSIDQFGELAGSELRFSVETLVDPSVFEERGCTVVMDPDDRRDDVEAAITAMQRMAEKQILAGHRQNYASLRRKNITSDLLPIEIGDTVAASSDEVTVTGWVVEFRHVSTTSGDVYTDIKLAVSRVDSDVTVTEDWTLPAAPTKFVLNSESASIDDGPVCPEITPDEGDPQSVTGGTSIDTETGEVIPPSHITPEGGVVVVMPEIGRGQVDEIVGTRKTTYDVEIPVDPFSVEVPNG